MNEEIIVRAALRDALSRPLRKIEQQALQTAAALKSMCGNTDCLEHQATATTDLSKRMDVLERGSKRLGATTAQTGDRTDVTTKVMSRMSRVLPTVGKGVKGARKGLLGVLGVLPDLDKKLGKVNLGLGNTRLLMLGIKAVGLLGLLMPLASILGAAGAGAVALVQALAPLLGLTAALPAGILALVTSLTTIKMAFADVGKAVQVLNDPTATLDQINAAMAGLTPEAQEMARTLHLFKPVMDDLRASAQAGLFPGVQDALELLKPTMGVISGGLYAVGLELGNTARNAAKMAATPMFQRDLAAILGDNSVLVGKMGTMLVSLLSAVRHIMVAAGPFVGWVGDMAVAFGAWADKTAAANRANGDTAGFLKRTQSALTSLGHILRDYGAAWRNIFGLSRPLADEGTAALERQAAAFRKWTESAEGQEKIAKWFAAMRPVLVESGRLLKQFTFGFLTLAQEGGPATTGILKQLQELGPVLNDLFVKAGNSPLIPTLIEIATNFALIANALPIGPLTLFLTIMSTFVSVMASVLLGNNAASAALRYLIAAALAGSFAFKAFMLILKMTKAIAIAQFIIGMTVAFRAQTLAVGASKAALIGFKVATMAMAAWTKIVTAAQWLWNAALMANPIGIAVLAIAVLVGGLIYLYRNSETARKIMDGLWAGIKKVASAAWDLFTKFTPLGLILGNLPAIWKAITNPMDTVRAGFDMLGGAVENVVNWIKKIDFPSPPGWIKDVGNALLPGSPIGDTNRPRAGRGSLGNSAAAHSAIDASVPGKRTVTSGLRSHSLGYQGSAHTTGGAFDLVGSGLNTYKKQVESSGGYAAFHGSGSSRHLHAEYGAAGGSGSAGLAPGATPHQGRAQAVGDTLRPRTRAMSGGGGGIAFAQVNVEVNNPASGIDVRREVRAALQEFDQDARERG